MAVNLKIDADYIRAMYRERIATQNIGLGLSVQDSARILSNNVTGIFKAIRESLQKQKNGCEASYICGPSYIIGVEDSLRTILKDTLAVEIEESAEYKKLKEIQDRYSYDSSETSHQCTIFWKREQEKQLRFLLGLEPALKKPKTNMNEFRKTQHLTDFIFLVQDKQFPVHKVVLAGHSGYFDAYFSAGFKEGQAPAEASKLAPVVFDDKTVTPAVFELLQTYIYTRNVDLSKSSAHDLLKLADLAKRTYLDKLFALCETHLLPLITEKTFFDIAQFAILHQHVQLIAASKYYLLKNKEFVKSIDFTQMSSADLVGCCDVGTALGNGELRQTAHAILKTKIDQKEQFEAVCDALCTSNIEEVKRPLKEAAHAFAQQNKVLLTKPEMQGAREAYVALMTGLERPRKPQATPSV